jgi:signal transduction histidine kinase
MLPVIVFAIVWGTYVIHQRANDLQAQLQERAQLLARQMAVAADYGIFSGNLGALRSLTLAVSREPSVMVASIYGANKDILATHRATESDADSQAINIDIRELGRQFPGQGIGRIHNSSDRWIACLEPVRSPALSIDDLPDQTPNTAINGSAVVVVSTKAINEELTGFVISVLALLVGVLASSWLIVRSFSSLIDRRIKAVALAAQQIGQGQSGVRLGPSKTTIFNRLSNDLNRMAEQLEKSRVDLERRVEMATIGMRQQRDEAERANTAKTRFLAAASHDLRQPMHALSLLFAALQQEQPVESRAQLLERIDATTQAMSSLLDALLDISRLDAGGVQAQREACELLPLLLSVRDTHDALAQRKGIELHVRPCKLWVHSDHVLLQRILGNFVSNAIRYTAPGGRVLIAARKRGQFCLLQVRDNGPGIDPCHQKSIFDEFVQIHNPQRDRSQGLGLGLAIVQRLANLLGHPVSLRSCPEKGSTFGLLIPIQEAASTGTEINPVTEPNTTGPSSSISLVGCRVLLVEDDALVRDSYERLLALWGCDVSSYPTAAAALAFVGSGARPPQIIISDYLLGEGTNGFELIAGIRQHVGTPIPAALITGNTEDPGLRQINDRSTRVIFKPVRPAMLMSTLMELLANKQISAKATVIN